MKFSRLIVPLDGSTESAQSVQVAAALAQRWQARMALVNVAVPLPPYGNAPVIDNRFTVELARTDLARLRETAESLIASHGIAVEVVQLEGKVVSALADYLENEKSGLVVMSSHGRGGASRLWLGSVTDSLIRSVRQPILVTRAAAVPRAVRKVGPLFQRVLVPLDGSPFALRSLVVALAFVTSPDVELHLVQVLEPELPVEPFPDLLNAADRDWGTELSVERKQVVREELERMAGALGRRLDTVRTHAVVSERPATAILDYAREHGVDLIAVATHGRGGLERAMVGSVADKIVRGAECPVVVCRPAQR